MTGFNPDFGSPREHAEYYRAKGFNSVPAIGKQPAVNWKEYQNELVPQDIADSWWAEGGRHYGNDNMGVLLGKGSGGMFMVDLDTYKPGGEKASAWWQGLLDVHNNGMELETWEQVTGGGGRQLFFHCPPGWTPPNVTTNIFVDIKGQGGFAVLPPSRHASGKLYRWREGRSPDDIPIAVAPKWLCDEIDRLDRGLGGGKPKDFATGNGNGKHEAGSNFDNWGHRKDGREDYLTRFVWGAALDYRRAEGAFKPLLQQMQAKAEEKYAQYERSVTPQILDPTGTKTKQQMLEDEERGPTAFWQKWQRAMDQWDGKLADEAGKPSPKQAPDLEDDFAKARQSEQQAKTDPSLRYDLLDIAQIEARPDPEWLVSGLIIEKATGFIYGNPGSWKTFIGLDVALSIACGLPQWWGHDIKVHGPVIYITSENQGDLKFRLKAWRQHRAVTSTDAPFRLLWQNVNFMSTDNRGRLLATIQSLVDDLKQPIAAIFVDTISRVLPGTNENAAEEMSLFVGACDEIRQRFGVAVVGVHHKARAGNMRGSTVLEGAGDFVIEVVRDGEDDDDEVKSTTGGLIRAAKIKAAVDQWSEKFDVKEVQLSDIAGNSSLVVDLSVPEKKASTSDNMPSWDACRQILSELHHAWQRKQPWSASPRAVERYGVTMIMEGWPGVARLAAETLLKGWRKNGIITIDRINGKDGYRKLKEL